MEWQTPRPRLRHWIASALLLTALPALGTGSVEARTACPATDAPPLALDALRAEAPDDEPAVTVEGVVTGVFAGRDQLGGFYLQNDDPEQPVGLFVYAPDQTAPRAGHRVRVEARFTHHRGRPQLSRVQAIHDCGYEGKPDPVALRLPRDAERLTGFEDIRVRFEQTLTVTGNYDLARYGSLDLAAEGRLWHPGQTGRFDRADHEPRRIVLDDGSYRANPDPIPYLDARGTRRAGSQVRDLTGILTHAFDAHRLHPTEPPDWSGGERPDPPPAVRDGDLRIATANLENDFVTLGERGAATRAERRRQTAKLNAALLPLEAHALGVIELENTPRARRELVQRLNQEADEGRDYRAVPHPDSGSDAIKVGLVYDRERLELLDAGADTDAIHDRPPLLAWFRDREQERVFGIVAVHFKAKSGCPEHGDIDRGQGCWNQRRTAQAERLAEWIDGQRRAQAPIIIAGDLNAYAAEDPLRTLRAAGKQDLVHDDPATAYSYVFRGQAGQLDYLLGPQALRRQVRQGGNWAINADEPRLLGFDGAAPAAGPWRSSDHDPVWADLQPAP